jgi:hypothetical protein
MAEFVDPPIANPTAKDPARIVADEPPVRIIDPGSS